MPTFPENICGLNGFSPFDKTTLRGFNIHPAFESTASQNLYTTENSKLRLQTCSTVLLIFYANIQQVSKHVAQQL